MQPMFGLTLFLSENNVVPVQLEDATGGALTGYLASSVSFSKSLNGAALASFVPASGEWTELGNGLYELTIPAATLSAEGPFVYRAAAGSNPAFAGFARVEHRLDQYVCHISPQYDEVTLEFSALVWLTKNGQIITDPANCQIWLKDTADTTAVNISGTATELNADGVFVLTQSSVALSLNMNYECKISIQDSDGATHTNVDGAITFN